MSYQSVFVKEKCQIECITDYMTHNKSKMPLNEPLTIYDIFSYKLWLAFKKHLAAISHVTGNTIVSLCC